MNAAKEALETLRNSLETARKDIEIFVENFTYGRRYQERRKYWTDDYAALKRRMGWPDYRENKTERRGYARRIGITNDRRRQERRTYRTKQGVAT